MSLPLLALTIIAGLWMLIYGGSWVLQNWLYSVPADHFLLRALGSAALVGGFLTFWCWLDTRYPGKYDTLVNFSAYEIEDADYVDAVKKVGDEEKLIRLTKYSTGSQLAWKAENGQGFHRSDSEGPVIAILVPDKDGKMVRFTTKVDDKGRLPAGDIVYREQGGKRYIEGGLNIGRVYRPGTLTIVVVLLINLAHFAVWTLAFWLGMRFALGHALSLAAGLWLIVAILVMPVLFGKTRKPIRPAAAPVPQVAPAAQPKPPAPTPPPEDVPANHRWEISSQNAA